MADPSPLANAIQFFQNFGLFDVVLPFLLVFTIVFSILEKTMILGATAKESNIPKKNVNSMVAFVIALLTVASNKIVTALQVAIPNIVLLMVVSISFLMLVGTFATTGEFDLKGKHKGYYAGFIAFLLLGVIIIFLYAIKLDSGQSWLEYVYNYIINSWGGSIVSSFVLLAVIVGAIIFITRSKTEDK
ncbi:MAG: hypothetical protein KJ623_00305 [Nanoarchaeota archaeon]|nr:hypothetical protein [Nanoarchaeota archaeon]MBU0962957.1 hypothetical protein [Nanoarchaeota archaeon]